MLYLLLLPLILLASGVAPIQPDEATKAKFVNSPFVVYDWDSIGRHKINRKINLHDSDGLCCVSNYSAVWDVDDELIAFALDNLLCPKVLKVFKLDAVGPDQVWETLQRALDRVHGVYRNDTDERFYEGNFPGVTNWPVNYDVLMTVRRCLTPFVNIFLDSEQYQLKHQITEQKYLNKNTHVTDEINLDKMSWKHVDGDDGDDDGNNEDEDDDEYDDNDTNHILGNPLLPGFKESFWASASLPPNNITAMHSGPHTDSTSPGLASVYTLTNDSLYEKSGTSFCKCKGVSILHNQELADSRGHDGVLIQSLAVEQNEPIDSGWLNASSNRFSDMIVLAPNKYNRFILYPSNRYHTAFIPDESMLNSDPHKGRLTLNSFWQVWTDQDQRGVCSDIQYSVQVSNTKQGHGINSTTLSKYPESSTSVQNGCSQCAAWQTMCSWCPYTLKCEATSLKDLCLPQEINNEDFSPIGYHTTCVDASTLVESCIEYRSCDTCVESRNGCAWCANAGRCTRDLENSCQSLDSHITKLSSCKPELQNWDCSQHMGCTTCMLSNNCHWILSEKICVAAVLFEGDIELDIVGKFGLASCQVKTSPKHPDHHTSVRDCVSPLSCHACQLVKGCGWCDDTGVGECVSNSRTCVNKLVEECPLLLDL